MLTKKTYLTGKKHRTITLATFLASLLSSTVPIAAMAATPTTTQTAASPKIQSLSGLSVGNGTTQVLNVTDSSVLNLNGNLNNLGTLYIVSTNPHVTTASISAQNIFNGPHALITTVLPAGGLPQFSVLVSNLSLNLIATQNILNQGAIISANNLTAIAGGTIVNSSQMGSTALMQSTNNLNLLASSITNSGILSSINSNVTLANSSSFASIQQSLGLSIANALQQNININNIGGLIQAINGAVNIGSAEITRNSLLSLVGGSVRTPVLNVDGGQGAVQAQIDNLSGVLNLSACSSQFGASNGVLTLGNLSIAGDPTFFNNGSISIQGSISVGQDLAIIASGDITANGAYQISTNSSGVGHDVYMIAGANFTTSGAPTPSPVLPSLNMLAPGQTVQVTGGTQSGGSISLSGSTINTSSSISGSNGGNVHLIAFAGTGKGGVSNATIITNGAGKASNGDVTVIAGGTAGLSNTGISGISIDNSKSSIPFTPNVVQFISATPVGVITFNDSGIGGGALTPVVYQARDILVTVPVTTGGDNFESKTLGTFTNTAAISTDGVNPGQGAGSLKIEAGTINLQATISARGANGAAGNNGILGLGGGRGQAGGDGAQVTLTGTNGININADILAGGGNGGNGGNGSLGLVGLNGASGGAGGGGGLAALMSLKTTDAAIVQAAGFNIVNTGGNGGQGGKGGDGTLSLFSAGAGGAGGGGGGSALGGGIQVDSSKGDSTFNGNIDNHGGIGGDGGAGGNGASDPGQLLIGGAGGNTGISAGGSGGGTIFIQTSSGNITVNTILGDGGRGGQTLSSGNGGDGLIGGSGGIVFGSGGGGGGGMVTLNSSGTGKVTINGNISLKGGAGGDLSFASGAGGKGLKIGGAGGQIQPAGGAALGGSISSLTNGAILINGNIDSTGGAGGSVLANSGKGGGGLMGGASGGAIIGSGGGAQGGRISFTTMAQDITINSTLKADGGAGGAIVSTTGDGGAGGGLPGSASSGGNGGGIGIAGGAGGGGAIDLSAATGVSSVGLLSAKGGSGGNILATGGKGGNGVGTGAPGLGGSILNAGDGGGGGMIGIKSSTGNISLTNVDASGNMGGGQFGTGGAGGSSGMGANGGSVGDSGKGGRGGSITIQTGQLTANLVTIDNGKVLAEGGVSGVYSATGGRGGDGFTAAGGNGGGAGNQGDAGHGGSLTITTNQLTITPTALLSANGGNTTIDKTNPLIIGYGGTSGDGGNGGGYGSGGNGGAVGRAGDGGGGGDIFISAWGNVSINSDINGSDAIAVRGGTVADDKAVSGKGGNAGITAPPPFTFANGGSSGLIDRNGDAGQGGNIFITGISGKMIGVGTIVAAGGQVGTLLSNGMQARSGIGGNAGQVGIGGRSGDIGRNGNGGGGGNIFVTTLTGDINLSPLIAAGGDVNSLYAAHTGNGGKGGSLSGNGGSSGDIANNGDGGNGGFIFVSSLTGSIKPVGFQPQDPAQKPVAYLAPAGPVRGISAVTGDGGSATIGNGGSSGMIGNNGKGGVGGTVVLLTGTGDIVTPKGSTVATGGDAGIGAAVTGKGGDTGIGIGGSSNRIGSNGGGGKGGNVFFLSLLGNLTIGGPVIARGGVGNGNTDQTGSGGNSVLGQGGDSGGIGYGADGGKGGIVFYVAGNTINMSEATVVSGGNVAAGLYKPVTGNGGSGAARGGSSGDIGNVGVAGKGGDIIALTLLGDINPDHMFADGGSAGATPFPPFVPGGDGKMYGISGDGGASSNNGGSAGKVGVAGVGGDGGTITVNSARLLTLAVQYTANGGMGGEQAGIGGKGGAGTNNTGGNGGNVIDAGDGGGRGQITLSAQMGPGTLKTLQAYGGDGAANSGKAGDGGDGAVQGGKGGSIGSAGTGGHGGTWFLSIAKAGDFTLGDNTPPQPPAVFDGGAGGALTGSAGKGGNGTGTPTVGGTGGSGGTTGNSGGGGGGGTVFISTKGLFDMVISLSARAGMSGLFGGSSGAGGYGTNGSLPGSVKPGGAGGKLGDQGRAGDGGTILMSVGSLNLPANRNIFVYGGLGQNYVGTSGKGGNGGGDGGAGGDVGAASVGGAGGTLALLTGGNIVINGAIDAGGGDRGSVSASAGSGGDAGAVGGGTGGAGGSVLPIGDAGKGGNIVLLSLGGSITGTGLVSANGGTQFVDTSTFKAGDGGKGYQDGTGGAGGIIGKAGDAGVGGNILLYAYSDINIPIVKANGGIINAAWNPLSGNGGAASGLGSAVRPGGAGGMVGSAGSGGNGGNMIIISGLGNVTFGTLSASGGNSSDMGAIGGNGGTRSSGDGGGGAAGLMGDNGKGGDGGFVSILTLGGAVNSTAVWDLSGGSVGNYTAKAGNGGSSTGQFAPAGSGGDLGSNGKGGHGGELWVFNFAGNQSYGDDIKANGGGVGAYTGQAGNGGTSPYIGGVGGSVNGNGEAGGGGTIWLNSLLTGSISTAAGKGLFASAGSTSSLAGKTGAGGTGGSGNAGESGGTGGGVIGLSSIGAKGGNITAFAAFGNVTINGDTKADGSVGGSTNSVGRDGAAGSPKGGDGGSVVPTATGGAGGTIQLLSLFGTVTSKGLIHADGQNGGTQNGKGGAGGAATPGPLTVATGGNGGSVMISGAGGDGGTIQVFSGSGKSILLPGSYSANFGVGGIQNGIFGAGGTPNGLPGKVGGTGLTGQKGSITIDGKKVMNIDDDIEQGDLHNTRRFRRQIALNRYDGRIVSGAPGIGLHVYNDLSGACRIDSNLTESRFADFFEPSEKQSHENKPADSPVSFVQLVPPQPDLPVLVNTAKYSWPAALVTEVSCKPSLSARVAQAGTHLSSASEKNADFELTHGEVLFAPGARAIQVLVPHGKVEIKPAAKVLIEVRDNAVVIRTLHDRKRGDVQFVCGDSRVEVNIGRQLSVCKNGQQAALRARDNSGISLRQTSTHILPTGHSVSISEFSLASAITNNAVLKQLYQSRSASARKHAEQILKNACILTMVGIRRGPFR